MSRAKPVAIVGRVNVLAPTGNDPYYRFTWTRPNGTQGRTRACRRHDDALAKAQAIDEAETRAADPRSTTTLGQVAELCLSSPSGRNQKTGLDWTHSHHHQVTERLTRMLHGFEDACVLDYDRSLADRIRSQAGTANGVRQNTSILRGLVRWGAIQGRFTATQAELLPVRCLPVAPSLAGTAAPRRREAVRAVGTSERYIAEEDAPSVRQVRLMGDELELRLPGRGKLAAELAADSGPRKAELLQLTARDIVRGAMPCITIDWQFDDHATQTNGQPRRVRPKGGKTRVTGVAVTSLTGYPLRAEGEGGHHHGVRGRRHIGPSNRDPRVLRCLDARVLHLRAAVPQTAGLTQRPQHHRTAGRGASAAADAPRGRARHTRPALTCG